MTSNPNIPDTIAFNITPIDGGIFSQNLPGYYLRSTASINVEDTPGELDRTLVEQKIEEIASHLIKSDNPQLVIAIHGYANQESVANQRYREIYEYAKTLDLSNSVFLGYRWPSENPAKDDLEPGNDKPTLLLDKIKFAFQSLPILLLGIFISSLVLGIVAIFILLGKYSFPLWGIFLSISIVSILLSLVLTHLGDAQNFLPIFPNGVILAILALAIGAIAFFSPINLDPLLVLLVVVFVLFVGIILTLIALRLSTYPRDRHRATNYGVTDLVEFIRQIDLAVMKQVGTPEQSKDKNIEIEDLNRSRIRLSFIAHSLGCEVVTQSIRILSDVFDPESIETREGSKHPSSKLGRVFSLGRLVLVAPDIPLESILSGRANVLRASLRRCEEAYVFSNEGDLALRLASTAANYFSFPTRTRYRSYKLGNITARHFSDRSTRRNGKLNDQDYGMVNFDNNSQPVAPYDYLEIRASNLEHRNLEELEKLSTPHLPTMQVADFFTYFDCTDYVDFQGSLAGPEPKNQKAQGIVSHALGKSALTLWWDYIFLSCAYFLSIPGYINVHGGYFEGKFSQKLIYSIAFLGFTRFLLTSSSYSGSDFKNRLDQFSKECREKKIQVVLSTKLFQTNP